MRRLLNVYANRIMKIYNIDGWDDDQANDLYDLICEYLYEHNFDEEYLLGEQVELDDVVLEIKEAETQCIEVGVLDANMVLINFKSGFMHTYPYKHDDDYSSLQRHVEDALQEVQ